jgi:glycosylphosphatidylinositol transamidase
VLESTLRSINNLLERLHASFFFYLLLHPGWFVKIGNYLPAAILIGAGLTIGGIRMWVQSGWVLGKEGRWTRRARGLDLSLSVVGVALALGLVRIKAQENGMSESGVS